MFEKVGLEVSYKTRQIRQHLSSNSKAKTDNFEKSGTFYINFNNCDGKHHCQRRKAIKRRYYKQLEILSFSWIAAVRFDVRV